MQGNLLFALNPADITVNRGVIRALRGEMATAGLFDFKTTNDQYHLLFDAARADFTYESYTALNNFERSILGHT